ncbi:MAG: methylenetetrahydrofolate reductase C-terminal domain-containing protein [Pseudomonadota bacterium]
MIVAEQKPMPELQRMLKGKKKVLAVGCGTCVSVCFSGGKKETGALASALTTAARLNGEELEVEERTVQRQCVQEFIAPLDEDLGDYDAVLSLGCGVGVQALAERNPKTRILPGLDTNFMGQPTEPGIWEERCVGCGHCVLEYTGGLCPITRCPKQLMNGPCGGSENGMCEVDTSIPCVWSKIWSNAENLNLIDELMEVQPPKDWSSSRGGGLRRTVVRDDLHQPSAIGAAPSAGAPAATESNVAEDEISIAALAAAAPPDHTSAPEDEILKQLGMDVEDMQPPGAEAPVPSSAQDSPEDEILKQLGLGEDMMKPI